MPVTVAQVKALFTADTTDFEKKTKQADKTVKDFAEKTKKRLEEVAQAVNKLGQVMSLGLTAPLIALGRASVDASVKMDSLKRGLTAVSGSAAATEVQLKRLKEVAKLPGLGFEEAVQGSVRLQAAGISAKQAERSLMAFGNALATVGKGKADLDGVTLALSQIESKGKVSAEEINQLAERVPQIRKAMIDAFGTADTEILQKAKLSSDEFINGLLTVLEKANKATGGLQNSFENASDSINESLRRIGDALAPIVAKILDKVVPAIESLTKAFTELPKQTQELIIVLGALTVAGGPLLLVTGQILELGRAIGIARLAALGPIAGVAALVGVGAIAGLAAWNADSDRKIAEAETPATVALKGQLAEANARVTSAKNYLNPMRALGKEGKLDSQGRVELADSEAQFKAIVAERDKINGALNMMQRQQDRVQAAEQKRAAEELHKQQIAAAQAVATARKKIQDAMDAAARKKAEAELKKAQAEAERLRNLNNSLLDDYKQLTNDRYDYERFRAKQDYDEALHDGANKVLAHKRYIAQIRDITLRMLDDVSLRVKQSPAIINDLFGGNRRGINSLTRNPEPAGPDPDFAQFPLDIHRDSPLGRPDRRTAIITEKDINAQNAAIEALQTDLVRSARRSSRQFLSALFGGERERNSAFKNLVEDLKKNLIDGIINSNLNFAPLIEKLTSGMRDGMIEAVNATLRVAQTGIGQILGAVYQLLSGLNRKGGLNIGNFLGAAAGFALGGPQGAVFGFNAGGALASGDFGGALGAAAVYGANGGFGGIGPIGGGAGGGVNGATSGANAALAGRGRSVSVNYNGPIYVNERADIERLGRENVRRLDLALAAGTG